MRLITAKKSKHQKTSRKSRVFLVSGLVLCVLGIVGVAPTLYFMKTNTGSVVAYGAPKAPTNFVTPPKETPVISGHPVQITIPSLKMTVPVTDGNYNKKTGEWTLSLNKAHYAVMSPQPNNASGNTWIYGHYRPEVFAYLHLIKPGSEAIITTNNGYRFYYTFAQTYATTPTDTSLLSYQGPPILTVQTCSGAWFQNRQMFQFNLVRYEKV